MLSKQDHMLLGDKSRVELPASLESTRALFAFFQLHDDCNIVSHDQVYAFLNHHHSKAYLALKAHETGHKSKNVAIAHNTTTWFIEGVTLSISNRGPRAGDSQTSNVTPQDSDAQRQMTSLSVHSETENAAWRQNRSLNTFSV